MDSTRLSHLLLLDKESLESTFLKETLESEGYTVHHLSDGSQGLNTARHDEFGLVISEVLLSGHNGYQVCRDLRSAGVKTPFMFLTERNSPIDIVTGLDLGADDYIGKPFDSGELLARVRALLRRNSIGPEIQAERIEFSDVVIDFKAYKAARRNKAIALSAREFRLLHYLIKKQGIVISRDELLDQVWGYNSYPSTRTVDNHIARLRQKIEDNGETPKHIITVHGVGYKFVV